LTAGSQQAVATNGNPDNVSNALAVSIDGFRVSLDNMNKQQPSFSKERYEQIKSPQEPLLSYQ